MTEETTIILELTPREAAAILGLTSYVSWYRGHYGEEVRNICRALEDVVSDESTPILKTWFGDVEPDQIFLVENDSE